jgi:hypothetical protein
MATLDLDKVTWKKLKGKSINKISEFISEEKYHYLYEPISWEILKILVDGTNVVQSACITIAIDNEEQFRKLYSTWDRDDKWQHDIIYNIMGMYGWI